MPDAEEGAYTVDDCIIFFRAEYFWGGMCKLYRYGVVAIEYLRFARLLYLSLQIVYICGFSPVSSAALQLSAINTLSNLHYHYDVLEQERRGPVALYKHLQ